MHFLPSTFPLIQAPMAGAQDAAMAAAVCRAGGLGSLPAAMWDAEKLSAEIEKLHHAAGGAPFNVNFFAHRLPEVSDSQRGRWHALLAPYFGEFGIDAQTLPEGVLRRPFDEKQLAVVEKYRPAAVSFHFGLPEKNLLAAVKDTGAKILASATTAAEALWLAENGADAVIAQGWEAGGHRGMFLTQDTATQVGLFALIAQIRQAVKLPVIAAGGIAGAQSIQAALKLGAAAVQIGTAYLLCNESLIPQLYRAALRRAAQSPADTAVTNLFSGKPARGLVNRFMRENGFIHDDALPFPYASRETGALRAAAEAAGSDDFSSLWCGQNPSGCREISAEELTAQWIRQVWENQAA